MILRWWGLLVLYISNHSWGLRFTIGKCSKSFLPFKLCFNKLFFVDPRWRTSLDILHETRKRLCWSHSKKYVNMIGHSIIAKSLWSCARITPVKYLYNSFFHSFWISAVLFLTAKIPCIWIWWYVFAKILNFISRP